MQIEYKAGDIILFNSGYVKEVEIEQVSVKAKCLKIDGTWYEAEDVAPKIKQVIGLATYKRGLFGTKRTVSYI